MKTQCKNFQKDTLWNCHLKYSLKICATPQSYLFFPKPAQEHCANNRYRQNNSLISKESDSTLEILSHLNIRKGCILNHRFFFMKSNFVHCNIG